MAENRLTQAAALALTENTAAKVRLGQGAALVLTENVDARVRFTQLALLVLCDAPPSPPRPPRLDVFLTLNGVQVDVVEMGAKGGKPERIGKSVRSFAGNLRSTQRAAKRSWSFLSAPMIAADFASLQAAAPDGSFATCDGASLNAVLTCQVYYEGTDYVIDDLSFEQQIQINLVEV